MQKTVHQANSRGYFDHGWLKTHHSFSFGSWYDSERVNFGKLRVLNDDIVEVGRGFGRHQHDNMEIVSTPLKGTLAHKDSGGHEEVIKPNDVQVMSAGTGIWHSEYNHSAQDEVNFLQIWILPNGEGHEPRYDPATYDPAQRKNKIQTIVAPKEANALLWLNQDAYFSLADLDEGNSVDYSLHSKENGLYLFVIEGEIETAGEQLGKRDAIGIWETDTIRLPASRPSKILLIEVLMA
ncbi:pirin family protein [candidate division KSB1 bacterium]|nr:pirin family protein [candidate division KSB1 bacterium]